MGLLYASYLIKNNDVTLIEHRKETVDFISKNGVNVTTDGVKRNYKISIVESGTLLPPCDLFIVFVKNVNTNEALMENLSSIDDHTNVLTLQNGYGSVDIISQYVNKNQIYVGTSKHNSLNLGNGNIVHTASGITNIGTYFGDTNTLEEIVSNFNQAGLSSKGVSNVNYVIFEKLILNACMNALSALYNTTFKSLLDDPYAFEILKNIIKEGIEVVKNVGVNLDLNEELNILNKVFGNSSEGKSSMCQDILAHRKTEVDFINGAISSLGKKYNIKTPYNDLMVNMIHFKEDINKNS